MSAFHRFLSGVGCIAEVRTPPLDVGYRWRPAELLNGKGWWTMATDPEAEIAWLQAEVYGREVKIPVHPITARERFSDRLWDFEY